VIGASTVAVLREAEAEATLSDVRRNFAALTELAERQRARVAELEAQLDALKLKLDTANGSGRYTARLWQERQQERDEARKQLATARDLVAALERGCKGITRERDALRAQLELRAATDPAERELHRARQRAARWKALARRLRTASRKERDCG